EPSPDAAQGVHFEETPDLDQVVQVVPEEVDPERDLVDEGFQAEIPDKCAATRPDLDNAQCRERRHRLAHGSAAYAEELRHPVLARKPVPLPQLVLEDV